MNAGFANPDAEIPRFSRAEGGFRERIAKVKARLHETFQRVRAAARATLERPEVKEMLKKVGFTLLLKEASSRTPETFGKVKKLNGQMKRALRFFPQEVESGLKQHGEGLLDRFLVKGVEVEGSKEIALVLALLHGALEFAKKVQKAKAA